MTKERIGQPLMVQVGELVTQRITDLPTSQTVVPKSIKRTLMAGFAVDQEVLSPQDAQRIVNDTHEKAGRYTNDQLAFASALKQIDVAYKTILPVKLFNQLCKEFGLIRFEEFTPEGEVYISRTKDELKKKFGYTSFLPVSILLSAVIAGIGGYLGFGLTWPTFVVAIAAATIAVLINRHVIKSFGKNPKFISWLFGELSISGKGHMTVQPVCPKLPDELGPVMKTLLPIAKKGKLFTAALPEAVYVDTLTFLKKVDGEAEKTKQARVALDDERNKEMERLAEEKREQRREFWRMLLAEDEPISYSRNEKGNLIAVHFQFGDFPREKEFMQRIENITDYELFSYID